MNKTIILIAATLTLAACGGGTTQNASTGTDGAQTDATTSAQTNVESPAASEQKPEEAPDPFEVNNEKAVYNILKILTERNPPVWSKERLTEIDNNYKESGSEYRWNNNYVDFDDIEVNCLYLKKGGYYVMVLADGYTENPKQLTYFYENGNLKDVPKSEFIPQPTINDLYANADKFPKKAFEILDNEIKNKSSYVYRNGTLSVMFDPGKQSDDGSYTLPASLKGLKAKEKDGLIFPVAHYEWDGERFVRSADDKPLEEDLKLLEQPKIATPSDDVVYEILSKISKVRSNRFGRDKIKVYQEDSGNGVLIFTTDDGGDGAAYHVLSCFALNDGGYFVIMKSNEYIKDDYYYYTYIDGKLTKADRTKYIPTPDVTDVFPDANKLSKAATNTIKKRLASMPAYDYKDGVLQISFNPNDYEDGESFITETLANIEGIDDVTTRPFAKYIWDGDQFVKQ